MYQAGGKRSREDVTTHVREEPRLRRHRGSGGRGRGGAAAVLVVEGVARVRVVDVDALDGVVVQDARRRGGEAEAQAGRVGSAELQTTAVRGRVRVRVETWGRVSTEIPTLTLSRVDVPMLVPVSQPTKPVHVGAAVGIGRVVVLMVVGVGTSGHTLPRLKKLLGEFGSYTTLPSTAYSYRIQLGPAEL